MIESDETTAIKQNHLMIVNKTIAMKESKGDLQENKKNESNMLLGGKIGLIWCTERTNEISFRDDILQTKPNIVEFTGAQSYKLG